MTSQPTGLFPVADAELHAKGRQKMRGLALYISRVWEAAATTSTSLCHVHGMDVDTERVALEIPPALAAIRTLDQDVIRESRSPADERRYQALLASDPQGQVVRGLVLLRNADIHLPVTIDVEADRIIGGPNHVRVLPAWQPYDQLPDAIHANTRTSRNVHDAYRAAVGGHLVMDMLLDAFAFFRRCDPTLARYIPGSEDLEYFPLKQYISHDYDRRHPDQPSRPQVEAEVRMRAQQTPPLGKERVIVHSFSSTESTIYCGTTVRSFIPMDFTESEDQVTRDIQAGYPHVAITADGTRHVVSVDGGKRLLADGSPLAHLPLHSPRDHPHTEFCHERWLVAVTDAFEYRDQRHLRDC
ncbi:hypothetical protein [Streptomyces yaizuensis]|uniref:Uncharacterized protein n=1 Tax=Streptomyces yaizuensis TaxID=2989713 RepID=A0ABQ5NZC4_9ACTN|nr:hypothetical protein [Streptomyces sp. YSPA8]GLF95513.1 hypothetical protein SYYSPA8_14470 [Streptomyces sp. YSPA8]